MMIKVHKHKGLKYHGPGRVSLRMPTYHQLLNFGYKIRTRLPGVEDMCAKALKDKKDLNSNTLLANVFAPWPKKGSSCKMQARSLSKRLNIGVIQSSSFLKHMVCCITQIIVIFFYDYFKLHQYLHHTELTYLDENVI